MPSRRILLTASRDSLPHLAQLIRAWRRRGIAVRREPYAMQMPDIIARVARSYDLDAVLLVGSPRRAPATVMNSPFAIDRHGRHIPVAWLPATDPSSLQRFAAAAARVHQRAQEQTTVALLGQWHPRYLHLTDRIETLLPCHVRTFRWTADVIGRGELVRALGAGLGIAMYVGHGRPIGWVGYRGLRAPHFDSFLGEPLGAVVSLCCRTASRRRTGLSYAEALPLCGVTAASFGAVTETRHTDNTRWAIRICETLALGVGTLCELIARSAPPNASARTPYRLIGDPFAPLAAERSGARRAGAIPTYP